MDFTALARQRYSLRKYSSAPVEQQKIDSLLEVCRLAPTAHNNQPQRVLVISEPEAVEKLKKCTAYHFEAPLFLLVCYDKTAVWQREYDGASSGDIDAAIVGSHIALQAAALGLGSCWVMYFDPAAIAREFKLPEHIVPVALFPIGYPAEGARPSRLHEDRKAVEEFVVYQSF